MAIKSLDGLFVHFMRDVYHAEKQAVRQMKMLARKTENEELKEMLETHREETEGQVERLEKVFDLLDMRARGSTSDIINGIHEDTKEILEEASDDATRDAGVIAGLQAVEHYEISRYGTMIEWAKSLGQNEAAKLLEETLNEEKATDQKLSKLAKKHINEMAKTRAREAKDEAGKNEGGNNKNTRKAA